MKTIVSFTFFFFISINFSGMNNSIYQQDKNTITATFNGVTEDEMFQFTDSENNSILFYRMSDEIEISLYDDELIGLTFKITWKEEEIDEYDEEGEATGQMLVVKNIIKLEKIN
ncbi:MAG: hypothetical protein HKP59_10300 [Lutibacter sp.]|uniref:hypothetical protein n=1 Tax=Lutibacter sp. TaxID=1925666 RepID=UPI00183007B9|nr:hypothetical protein [Lutibacter sp.]MBT8318004.1 hypothetical protein [Lutibacter sp.]NNJ58864.1 hypothetical protein [Lutibacter sp.]